MRHSGIIRKSFVARLSGSQIAIALLTFALSGKVAVADTHLPECSMDANEIARAFQASDAELIHRKIGPKLAAKISQEKIAEVLSSLNEAHGSIDDVGPPVYLSLPSSVASSDPRDSALSFQLFFSDKTTLRLMFACRGAEITGFHIIPGDPQNVGEADLHRGDVAFSVPYDPYPVQGFLTSGTDPNYPAVVLLISGSGPIDADGSFQGQHEYADLAHGLAQLGPTVLRFSKRPAIHPEYFGLHRNWNLSDEYENDIGILLKYIASDPVLRSKSIVLVGHSLGADVALRIASRTPTVGMVVVLEGRSLSVPDLLEDQFRRFGHGDAGNEDFEREIANLRHLDQGNDTEGPFPFGMSAAYARDWMSISPTTLAASIEQPVLVILGEDDETVSLANLPRWETQLNSRPRKEIVVMKGLTHVLSSSDTSQDKPSFNEELPKAITRWIRNPES